ncbi:MAG TPA: iron ABC transporter permease [Firmicutes bacterium]|nr:iron ABC transporter permease [Bacillota bacterium]
MTVGRKRKRKLIIVAAALAMAVGIILGLGAGAVKIAPSRVAWLLLHPGEAAKSRELESRIVWQMRLPRVLLACMTGGGLSIAGAIFQALFRNPMADPYIIGASSGAALGAVLVILFSADIGAAGGILRGVRLVPVAAFIGAIAAVMLSYALARVRNSVQLFTLLLSGVAVNAFFSAMVTMVIYFAGKRLHEMIAWMMMGGFGAASWTDTALLTPYIVIGALLAYSRSRDLNALSFGEEIAHVSGVDVRRVRLIVLAIASVLTAASVAAGGLIGFVGLVVPHLLRIAGGADHRYLIPASFFGGAAFLVIADTIGRTVIAPTELPVGLITALFGGPFFAWILRKARLEGQV